MSILEDSAELLWRNPNWTYLIFPNWGVIWFLLYRNGIQGWLDPGSWNALEHAANTTFPKIVQEVKKGD